MHQKLFEDQLRELTALPRSSTWIWGRSHLVEWRDREKEDMKNERGGRKRKGDEEKKGEGKLHSNFWLSCLS